MKAIGSGSTNAEAKTKKRYRYKAFLHVFQQSEIKSIFYSLNTGNNRMYNK